MQAALIAHASSAFAIVFFIVGDYLWPRSILAQIALHQLFIVTALKTPDTPGYPSHPNTDS
jgi:hypothetical protein